MGSLQKDLNSTKSVKKAEADSGSSWRDRLAEWAVYAAAAGATLASASSMEAAIVFVDPNAPTVLHSVPDTSHARASAKGSFSLGQGVEVHMALRDSFSGGSKFASAMFPGGNSGLDFFHTSRLAKNFSRSSPIGGPSFANYATLATHLGTGHVGNFTYGQTGFVGFVFTQNNLLAPAGATGWLRVEIQDTNHDGFVDEFEVINAAYNNARGITFAGEEPAPSTATPEPSTAALGLLGAGALGIMTWRKRRAAAL